MALTGKFLADFESFYSAVNRAEAELKGLETGAAKVQSSLNRMADSFSGRKIIQDAALMEKAISDAGGASTLTAREMAKVNAAMTEAIEKYRALGKEAPAALRTLEIETRAVSKATDDISKSTAAAATSTGSWLMSLKGAAGALGIAFSAGAVIAFGKQVFAAAGQIEDLSKKMGVSREAVQRWKFAAEQSGATIENVDKAVLAMNKSLGSIDSKEIEKTNDSLRRIGLSFSDLRQMKPEDAFNAITKAIGEVEDPMVRAKVATELFSKTGAELLPALADNFAKVADSASVMSDDTIKRLDEAEDAWNALYTKATVVTGELIAFLITEFSKENPIDKFFKDAKSGVSDSLEFMRLDVKAAAEDFRDLMRLKDAVFGRNNETPTAPGAPKLPIGAGAAAIVMTPEDAAKIEGSLKRVSGGVDEYGAALKRLNAVVTPLTADQRRLADAWLEQGKATKDIATVLRVSEDAVRDYKEQQQDLDKILQKGIGSVLGLGDSYKQLGTQMKLTDGIVSTLMVSLDNLKDSHLFGIGAPQIQLIKPELPKEIQDAANEMKRLDDISSNAVANLSRAFSDLGVIAGGALGDIMQGFAGLVSTIDAVREATDLWKAGMQSFKAGDILSGIAGMASGIMGIVSAAALAVKAIKGIWGALDRNKGRDEVVDFADSMGGFDALHAQLGTLGADGERLWIALTQGVGRNNPEQARAAIEAINEAFAKQKAEANGAANAIIDNAGKVTEAQQKALDAISEMDRTIKGLYASIANEAPEEVMGVIEANTRAEIAAIEAQRDAAKQAIDETTASSVDSAEEAADQIQRTLNERDFVAKLRFDYELPEGLTVGGGVPGFAGGTGGRYLDFGAGTLAMLHGRERVVTEAEGRSGGSSRDVDVAVVTIDGDVLLRTVVKARKRITGGTL